MTPLTRGIEISNGELNPIVKKNTPIPIKISKPYATANDNQTEISNLSENAPELNSEYSSFFGNDNNSNNNFDEPSLLQPPPQKQGTLDTPMPTPKPNALVQSEIPYSVQKYMGKENDLFSIDTEKLPGDDEFDISVVL